MKNWIFRYLFPEQRAMIFDAAKQFAEQAIGSEYRRKMMSLQRSPLDESEWVRKFIVLDADYAKLEKEMADVRIENSYLKMQLRLVAPLYNYTPPRSLQQAMHDLKVELKR